MSRAARLPSFLVIGAMKAGTTSLFHYLGAHPQVYMAPIKELDFFVEGSNWRRGTDWYARRFRGGSSAVAIGEASTAYTKYPHVAGVPERIAGLLPDVLLVYLIRDPIDRIRSHHAHRVAIGREQLPLDRAIAADPVYLDCSRYAMQIERYLGSFPRERLLLIDSRALRDDRDRTMCAVYAFIGVDPTVRPAELSVTYYGSDGRGSYPLGAWHVRQALKRHVPAAKRAKEFVDTTLPGAVATLKRPKAREREPIDDTVRSDLEGELREDVRRLRAFMPPGFDGWGIA